MLSKSLYPVLISQPCHAILFTIRKWVFAPSRKHSKSFYHHQMVEVKKNFVNSQFFGQGYKLWLLFL